jgi:hypothetical protein
MVGFAVFALSVLAFSAVADAVIPDPLPDPDGQPADMSKPVQVYILMGQSNMLGYGTIAGTTDGTLEYAVNNKGKYPYVVDGAGNWTTRQDVRYARVQSSGTGVMSVKNNAWLTVGQGNTSSLIGVELGIGHYLGYATDAPVLLIKSCIGNRALGWDLLPPGSVQYDYNGYTYPGYGGSPERWPTGTTPTPIGWYAGMQYDGDVRNAKTVLQNLDTYYPGATEYEVAGFFWWQGDRDRYTDGHAIRYEQNLVQLIEQLRKEFNAPDAKFVCATLGQTDKDATPSNQTEINEADILDAMFAVSDPAKYPQFEGNVATVYSHPLSMGSDSASHYGGNAETYMNVGEGMGKAMVTLIIPEPTSLALMAAGLAGIWLKRRR